MDKSKKKRRLLPKISIVISVNNKEKTTVNVEDSTVNVEDETSRV